GQKVTALAPDRDVPGLSSVVLSHVSIDRPERVGVQRAAQPTVGRHDDHERPTTLATLQVWMLVLGGALGCGLQDLRHLCGVRAAVLDGRLGAPEPGGRHHLHGLCDLLGVLEAPDPAPDVAKGWHGYAPSLGVFAKQLRIRRLTSRRDGTAM